MSHFQADDGVEIAYEVWAPGGVGSPPELPPVLLHHGFIADGYANWVATGFVAALVDAGRRVVTIDARGHGRSGKPHDPARYGERRMARDVSALVDVLAVDEIDLVGYSMGAVVSLLVASGSEKRLRKLAVGGVGGGVIDLGGVDTRALPIGPLVAAMTTDDPASITHPAAARFREFADRMGADRLALAAHAQAVNAEPIPLGEITVPTLLFVGDADPLAADAGRLADAVPGATLRIFHGDHLGVLADSTLIPALLEFLG